MNYVRNRANRPDKWENDVIENQFKSGSHPKGQHVAAMAEKKGKQAFRLILPSTTRNRASAGIPQMARSGC